MAKGANSQIWNESKARRHGGTQRQAHEEWLTNAQRALGLDIPTAKSTNQSGTYQKLTIEKRTARVHDFDVVYKFRRKLSEFSTIFHG